MYKPKKNSSKKSNVLTRAFIWLKRKFVLILAALMIGFSNGMSGRNDMVNANQIFREQRDKKD